MRSQKLVGTVVALFLSLMVVACTSTPATPMPTATLTLRAVPPTHMPTATFRPTAIVAPVETWPREVQLVGQIPLRSLPAVGHNPQAVAALGNRVYVANRNTNNVSVIEDGKVSAVIAVGTGPMAIAADEKTRLVYVANEGDDSISFLSQDRVLRTVPAPKSPACLVAWDGRLYAGGRGENVLAVLDGITGERIATVPLKASIGILALAVNPQSGRVYASTYDSVQIVDARSLKAIGSLQRQVYLTLGADAASDRFFIAEYDAQTGTQYLLAFDASGQKELGRARIGGDPRGMAVDSAIERIYVANSWSNDVSVVDGRSLRVITTMPVGLRPLAVAVDAEHRVYVVSSESDNVTMIDGQTLRMLGVVPLAMLPSGMAVHPVTGRLYVACASTNSVFVVQGREVAQEVPVGLHPTEVAISADGGQLFVLNHVSGDLSILSTEENRVLKTVSVAEQPQGLAVASQTGQVFVSDLVLDLTGERVLRQTVLTAGYPPSTVKPVQIAVDARVGRAFMVASNGIPGSNSGLVVYVVDLRSGELVPGMVGGLSTTALALDSEGQRVFSTAGRFGRFQLIVNDTVSLKQTDVVDLPSHPAALAYNPATHHVFICLNPGPDQAGRVAPELWVLDSRGWGTVGRFALPEALYWSIDPYDLAVDTSRGWVYVADRQRGVVHVLRDTPLPPPPSPTPTKTPTPWPTLTPQRKPTATKPVEPTCQQMPAASFNAYWSADRSLRLILGCPKAEARSGLMAEQAFERGYMVWREADRTIFVFYNDGLWRSFPDRWQEGMPEHACEWPAPNGLQQPKRGFGLVWCSQPGVKEGLGWALEEERGYTNEWQTFGGGEMILCRGRSVVYALFHDGTFRQFLLH